MEKCVIHGLGIQPVSGGRVLRSVLHPSRFIDPDRPVAMPGQGLTLIYPQHFNRARGVLRTAYHRLNMEADEIEVRIRVSESPRIQYHPDDAARAEVVYLHRLVPAAAKTLAEVSVETAARRGYLVRRADTLAAHERLSVIASYPHLLSEVLGLLGWTVGGVIYPVVSQPGDVSRRHDLWVTMLDGGLIESARSMSGHEYQVRL